MISVTRNIVQISMINSIYVLIVYIAVYINTFYSIEAYNKMDKLYTFSMNKNIILKHNIFLMSMQFSIVYILRMYIRILMATQFSKMFKVPLSHVFSVKFNI